MIRAAYMARSRRDRAILIVLAIVLLLVLGQLLCIGPVLAQRRALLQSMVQQQADLDAVGQRLAALRSGQGDPDAARKAQISVLQRQLTQVDNEFATHQRSLVAPRDMGPLLDGMLKQQGGLELVALRSLPVAPLHGRPSGDGDGFSAASLARAVAAAASVAADPAPAAASAGAGKAPIAAQPDATDTWLYVHGVQISVRGSYADMQEYLSRLEQLPRLVYWGPLDIDGTAWPASVMTVTIYTVSLERTWWAL